MQLTNEERAILAHVVVDVDAWVAHALSSFGQEAGEVAVRAKIESHRAAYLAAKDLPGYQTRAEQEADAAAIVAAQETALAPARAALQAADTDLRTNALAAKTRLNAIINDPTTTDTAAKVRQVAIDLARVQLRVLKYLVAEAR